jgi:hypothetical protein
MMKMTYKIAHAAGRTTWNEDLAARTMNELLGEEN